MRTTVDISEDVLLAARERAHRERRTLGEVLSDLARRGLQGEAAGVGEAPARYGFAPKAAPPDTVVSNELIEQLRSTLGED